MLDFTSCHGRGVSWLGRRRVSLRQSTHFSSRSPFLARAFPPGSKHERRKHGPLGLGCSSFALLEAMSTGDEFIIHYSFNDHPTINSLNGVGSFTVISRIRPIHPCRCRKAHRHVKGHRVLLTWEEFPNRTAGASTFLARGDGFVEVRHDPAPFPPLTL